MYTDYTIIILYSHTIVLKRTIKSTIKNSRDRSPMIPVTETCKTMRRARSANARMRGLVLTKTKLARAMTRSNIWITGT